MTGWTLFFTFVGVSVMVTKFVDFIEYIGGDARGRKRHADKR